MTQFFNRQEAEQAASEIKTQFPELRVWNVLDIHHEETKEYERSFFSVSHGRSANFYINSLEQVQGFFDLCQYVAEAIADGCQSQEHDRADYADALKKLRWD